MTAPADRAGRVTGCAARSSSSRTTHDDGDSARVDAEFAAIVAQDAARDHGVVGHGAQVGSGEHRRAGGTDDGVSGDRVGLRSSPVGVGAMPAVERCDRPAGSTALQDQVSRIASALFCASGLDADLLAFAIRRAADHHAVEDTEVADGIADEVLRIAVSLAAGR